MEVSHFLRQWLVVASPQLAALSTGGSLVYPTVLMQQFKTDSFMQLDIETTSWMGSMHGLGGIPSILILQLMQWKGRKVSFIATCLVIMIGWLLAYLSTNITTVLVSESIHGLGTSSLLAISMLSISEMVNPKYRNISLQSCGIVQSIGSVLAATMARYLHWKTIALVMSLPILIAMFIGCTWPESPSWLASKGKFDKCENAFTWLRGTDDDSQKELNEIIAAQKEVLLRKKNSNSTSVKYFWRTITRRDFYVPSIHMFILLDLMYWSGNGVFIIYCIDIIAKTTQSEIASLASIIVNSLLVMGYSVSCIFLRLYKNKSVLLTSSFCSTVCLLIGCVVTYLQSMRVLSKDSLIFFYCLMVFMVASSLGQIPVVFALAAEVMPVKHRGIGGAMYALFTCVLHASALKSAPYLFLYLDLWGTLLIYIVNATVCSLFIWKYVPETKNKPLQDIEGYYNSRSIVLNKTVETGTKLLGQS